jgi:uncharacterized membrane protein
MTQPTPTSPQENTLAAVAYILTILTGVIILLVAKKEQRYARWHAIQAIGVGIILIVAQMVLTLVAGFVPVIGIMVASLFGLIALLVIVFFAIKAYQGGAPRVPVASGFADSNA